MTPPTNTSTAKTIPRIAAFATLDPFCAPPVEAPLVGVEFADVLDALDALVTPDCVPTSPDVVVKVGTAK